MPLKKITAYLFSLFCLGFVTGSCNAPSQTADIVFINGTVFTANSANDIAQAVAVKDGRVWLVGDEAMVLQSKGPNTQIIDMRGGMLLPGFTDAHTHLIDGGQVLSSLSLHDATSVEEIVTLITDYVRAHPDEPVIVGSGWSLPLFAGGRPHKSILDEIEKERPLIIYASDGHNLWVNSKALELSGITVETANPDNGVIDRDSDGTPSGTLREAATLLVNDLLPKPTVAASIAHLQAAMSYQNSLGYTAAIEAAIAPGSWEEAYIASAQDGSMTMRVDISLFPGDDFTDRDLKVEDIPDRVKALDARRARIAALASPYLSARTVKIYADGVLENQTGALIEPYINSPHGDAHRGGLNIPVQVLNSYVAALDAAQFQTHIHAIGDLAVRASLDAIEYAVQRNPSWARKPHLAHIELIDPLDIPRFAVLGVGANMQTLWANADSYITDLTEPFLGDARAQWLYPNGALQRAGAFLLSGSDWPVSTSDPFDAIEVAVTRADPHGEDAPWLPQHRLEVLHMLRALTINGAVAMGQDEERGSIEADKRADLIVIDNNPFVISPRDISEISVTMTLLDGQVVYARLE